DDLVARGRVDGQAPRRLPARLVEARQRAARGERLELRDDVPIASLHLAEEAARGERIDRPAVTDGRDRLALGERLALRGQADEILAARERARGEDALALAE